MADIGKIRRRLPFPLAWDPVPAVRGSILLGLAASGSILCWRLFFGEAEVRGSAPFDPVAA